jgi:hypothetical protein
MGFKEPPVDLRVVCTCFAAPLLGALFYLQDQWWWWPIIERAPNLATLKASSVKGEMFAALRSGEVSQGDAQALGFLPGVRSDGSVTTEDALRGKTGPLSMRPTPKGWLRPCPACGGVPEIKRGDLYSQADAALAEGERTITVPV